MTKTALFGCAIALVCAGSVSADVIRERQFTYDYGDVVEPMEADAFVSCTGCTPAPLIKLPRQYLAIRVPQQDVLPTSIIARKIELVAIKNDNPQLLGSVHFQLDNDRLSKDESARLDTLLNNINDQSQELSVFGYTCTIGTKSHNQALSKRRAEHVAEYIKGKGFNVQTTQGRGDCCAISPDKRLNRRVDINSLARSKNDQEFVSK